MRFLTDEVIAIETGDDNFGLSESDSREDDDEDVYCHYGESGFATKVIGSIVPFSLKKKKTKYLY